jgi:endoglucanase
VGYVAATWGTGDVSTDWDLAAQRAGNAILDVNPEWLASILSGAET